MTQINTISPFYFYIENKVLASLVAEYFNDDISWAPDNTATIDKDILCDIAGYKTLKSRYEGFASNIFIYDTEDIPEMAPDTVRVQGPVKIGRLYDIIKSSQSRAKNNQVISIGLYHMKRQSFVLHETGTDHKITLTEKERDIILKLYDEQGGVVERDDLLREVWGHNEMLETHTLETHIYRLRQKIEKDPANPALILTEERGYKLSMD